MFSFTSGGVTLRGVSVGPVEESGKAVVCLHGWGTCRLGPQRAFVLLGEELACRGWHVFRFDLPGRGESGGDDRRVALDDMARAAADCVTYVRNTLPRVERVGFVGICSGGNTAVYASVLVPVDFLVLWSTFPFDPVKSPAGKAARSLRFLGIYLKKALVPRTWWKILRGAVNVRLVLRTLFGHYGRGEADLGRLKRSSRDVLGAWASFRGRVLFVYGEKDPGAGDARRAYGEFCSTHRIDASFVDIPGASHNFYREEWRRKLFDASIPFMEGRR